MAEEEYGRLHAIVQGRVQGVSFRYFVAEKAEVLGLNGWVRNLWNGNVEITAEGPRESLEKLLHTLREGPPLAKVAEVNFDWQPYSGEFNDFRVRSNAS